MAKHKYKMRLSLNVLNHLGINLYSNVPAVLAETVANSWDADAENVWIDIDPQESRIVIADDGHGMTEEDINDKYLLVGYERRSQPGEAITPKWNRPVMGRKGIGKLSLFSIADTIRVASAKDGAASGLEMSLPAIRAVIQDKEGTYHPKPLGEGDLTISNGTRVELLDFRKGLHQTEKALRRRLARRFSIIGPEHHFAISVNGNPISIEDRDYYHKLQYLWHFGDMGKEYASFCKNLEHQEPRSPKLISGWIGSVHKVGDLRDEFGENLNRIVIIVRGKLAEEDILEDFGESGIYSKYLIGEIHADFLDQDDEEDIATTSRQAIIEDDPRYQQLKEEIQKELRHIWNRWTGLRTEQGAKVALENPIIKEWFETLGSDDRKRARGLFGKINQITVDKEDDRRTLFKHGVLAFESLKYKQNLDALENIDVENISQFIEVIGHLDDLEATLYHQIISGRIKVVRALNERVEENALEKVLQRYLFDHLWLLDSSWERATTTEFMEGQIAKAFGKINAGLTKEEEKGRVDIKYRTTAGKHVVIELKRAGLILNTDDLLPQVRKYRSALKKILREIDEPDGPIEIVCVVGRELRDWSDPDGRSVSDGQLKGLDARVILYQ
jgi:hypothetical protein